MPEIEPIEPDETISEEEEGKNEVEQADETDKIVRFTTDTVFASESAAVRRANNTTKSISTGIGNATADEFKMNRLDSRRRPAFEPKEPTDKTKALEKAADAVRDDIADEPETLRKWCRTKYIALFLGITSVTLPIIIWLIDRYKTAAPAGLTDAEKKIIEDQVARWQDLPDATVWSSVVQFCERWNPSWMSQTLMMDTLKGLSKPLAQSWSWRGDDQAERVQRLVDAYGDHRPTDGTPRSPVLYRTVAAMAYDGFAPGTQVALPRAVAADLIELAIAQIILLARKAA